MTHTSTPQQNTSTNGPLTDPHTAPPSGYTRVDNTILDQLMPTLSGNGLKILLVALRQTWGWKDDRSPTGRKRSDQISYSQFMEKAGLSRATVARAIKECLDAGVLLRVKNGCSHTYAVNPHLTSPDSEAEPLAVDEHLVDSDDKSPAAVEPLPGSGTESLNSSESEPPTGNEPLLGSETEHTKQKNKDDGGGGDTPHILSLLKDFSLSVDQEVRSLAAQYTLPQVEYGVHRATQQARSNPQGLLRTWMRAGHMPPPPTRGA